VLLIIIFTFLLSGQLDLFEKFADFSRHYEKYQLDEIFLILIVLTYYIFFLFIRQKRVLKQKNKIITENLIEKSLLLKEAHHRQKNNINILLGLLKLDEGSFNTVETKDTFNKIITRLESMGILYENLQASENCSKVSVDKYFRMFFERLNSLLNGSNKNIATTLIIADFQLSPERLTPLGIMINELYTNAIKHAFPHQENCQISFIIKKTDNAVSVIFSDNGIGIPEDMPENSNGGFGHKLFHALAGQINATINIINDDGTTYSIHFPLKQDLT